MELKGILNSANELMNTRRSIRQYDESVKISREEMSDILQDAMTAPSSFNLQPWRFVVVESAEAKERIKPFMMFNETQWRTSSAIIAVYGDMCADVDLDKLLKANVDFDLSTAERTAAMAEKIKLYRASFTDEKKRNGITLDCGFVIMQLMLSAKAYGYDTNPIGGYMKTEMTEALGLDSKRYEPMLVLSIGKSIEKGHDTVRYSAADVTQWK